MPRSRSHAPLQSPLAPLTFRGANPGDLDALTYLPATRGQHPPLVVVLHGCTQTAAGYDHGAGWSALADAHGFALLFPQQRRANNPNLCFNWFEPGDVTRGHGEAASIAAMIGAFAASHGLDASRIYVTGLSAGGAMAAAMLAAYPELFAAGSIIAGLPSGVAHGVGEALGAMARPKAVSPNTLGDAVRAASHHAGPWPRVAVWHGDADRTVAAANGDAVTAQWRDVHGLHGAGETARVDGHRVRRWRDPAGDVAVEAWTLAGLGHGTPVAAASGGAVGPFFLEAGIASSAHIAAFFGIAPEPLPTVVAPARPVRPVPMRHAARVLPKLDLPHGDGVVGSVTRTINDALRAAGLLKR